MKETRYFYVPDAPKRQELPEEESQHAVRVLRMQAGDELMLMDGCGCFYRAEVTMAASHHCMYRILEVLPQETTWRGHLHLAIAPTKMIERMEWMIEKATEIGFDELSLLDCQFSERRVVKLPRLEKIMISAAKQSRKAWMPQLNEMQSFKSFLQNHQEGYRYIAHCYEEVPRVNLFDELRKVYSECDRLNGVQTSLATSPFTETVMVLVGPEGDFSIDEVRMAVEAGFVSVDLGKSRLRTETAGLMAVSMMQLSQQ